ncbi:hypothetical protein [Frondihabitans cladoniiphilus]
MDRPAWERRILAGTPVSVVAADTPYSVSAANRHLRQHLRPALSAEVLSPAADLHVSDFAEKLVSLVSSAHSVRRYAESTANPRLILQSIKTEADVLETIMRRLGIDSEEGAEDYVQARKLTSAVGALVRSGDHPEF